MHSRLCSLLVFLLLLVALPSLLLDAPQATAQKASVPAQDMLPASPEATAATPETLISETRVDSFAIHNLRAYYSRHLDGDIGSTCTSQLWYADLAAGTSDKRIENDDCDGFEEIQLDNISVFYANVQHGQIERRLRQDNSQNLVLATFDSTTRPQAMALDNQTTMDGYLYWAAADNRIRRVDKYGSLVEVVAATNGRPRDLSIDERYIWWVTSQGIYRIERSCNPLPCATAVQQNPDGATAVYGATPPGGGASVFWVTETDPPRVESWDCNIPGGSACIHKNLYAGGSAGSQIDTVIASAEDVYWMEFDPEVRLELNKIPRDGSVPAGTVVYPVLPAGNTYDRFFVDDVSLYFNHQGISRIGLDETVIVWDYVVDAIELSQGTQTLDHDVGLVAGMPAMVRVYARQLQGPPESFVRVKLAATRGGVPLAGSPLYSHARFGTDNAWTTSFRTNIRAAEFAVPPEWTGAGDLTLTATVDPESAYDLTPATRNTTVSFVEKAPICIVSIPVSVHGPPYSPSYDSLDRRGLDLAIATTRFLLPNGGIWRYKDSTLLEEGSPGFYSPYELPADQSKMLSNLEWRSMTTDWPDECQDAGARVHYAGIFTYDFDPGFNGVGRFDDNVLALRLPFTNFMGGWSPLGWPVERREGTLAHELGHNYGREHVPCGPTTYLDYNYPYTVDDYCWFGDYSWLRHTNYATTFYYPNAWGSGAGAMYEPSAAHDLMAYGAPRWPSDYTWNAIFGQINSRSAAQPAAPAAVAGDTLHISGMINVGSPVTGTLDYAWDMPADAFTTPVAARWQAREASAYSATAAQAEAPAYHVQIYRMQFGVGHVLVADVAVPELARTDTHFAPDTLRAFRFTTPTPSGMLSRIDLMADSTVLARLEPSIFAHSLTVHTPVTDTVVGDELTVGWRADNAYGGTLEYLVQYSPDAGSHWYTIGSNYFPDPRFGDYTLSFDTASLPGSNGNDALVRVIASNGAYTAYDVSPPFSLLPHAPDVYLEQPMAGNVYPVAQPLLLSGTATDPEEGALTGGALAWQVDGTGVGSGETVLVEGLAPGTYAATLTATPATGAAATASASFELAPLAIGEGDALLDGRCYDAAYGEGDVVGLERYGDGNQALAAFARNGDYFFACFSGLRQGANPTGAFAGIRVDVDHSQDALAQSADYGFFVRQNGTFFARSGDGAGGFGVSAPELIAGAFSARTHEEAGTWSAELRLDLDWMRAIGWDDRIGLKAGHYWVDRQADDYDWPYRAVWNRPATWAEALSRRAPLITHLNPYTMTVPADSYNLLLEVHGRDFASRDTVLWDGTPVTTYYSSASLLYAIVPNASLTAGYHAVRVLNGVSTALTSQPADFTIYHREPVLTALSPSSAIFGEDPVTLTLFGSDFAPGASVYWNNRPLSTSFLSSSALRVTLGAEELDTTGVIPVTVVNPEPAGRVSNSRPFAVEYVAVAPNLRARVSYVDDLGLGWSEHDPNCTYDLLTTTIPYSQRVTTTAADLVSRSYTVRNVVGDPATNHYYAVLAKDCIGQTTALSNWIGEFDFRLSVP